MPKGDKLPPKQRLFLKEWMIDKNAAEAYKRAYHYKGENASVMGSQLLAKLNAKNLLAPEIKAQEEKAIITADETLKELRCLGKCDISLAFDKTTGNLLPIHEIPEDVRRAIAGWEIDETGKRKIKFWDKNKSLETIARHLKMLTDKVEHSATGDLAEMIRQARERK